MMSGRSIASIAAAFAALTVVLPGPGDAGLKEQPAFTRAQAAAGAKAYEAKCSRCHGENLEGVSAPALRGAASGLKGDTVGEAYRFISTQMPAGDPGSLPAGEYAAIVAFILSRNGHPAGSVALTARLAPKIGIKL